MVKNRTMRVFLSGLAGVILLAGCSTPSVAPMTESGGPIKLSVLVDRGVASEMESRQWQYRKEVGAYMEQDLIGRLNRTGYEAQLIEFQEAYISGPGTYLVVVKIKRYNPGSSAARIAVGFGAGSCSLDLDYAIYEDESDAIQEWSDGIGTSGDWRRIPRALNDKLVRKLNSELLTWK